LSILICKNYLRNRWQQTAFIIGRRPASAKPTRGFLLLTLQTSAVNTLCIKNWAEVVELVDTLS
jgi:hypothetical protein